MRKGQEKEKFKAMDNLTGADNIRKEMEMEENMASGKLAKKKTMSVPEMRKLLGIKKTESYWLVHRNFFQDGDHQWPDAC
ncbi:hypothetical protein BACPEC_02222 [[Bacteroides] pectinophilus ATCC 43243]|uniref:Uncharacterized protein n=1 Tax=[Bacteroides] pectinophilus ATCC 43243 TaxID=483218 RepID=B7AU34_9FIRM|nr:hypothetical protein BACPEC_02222 [[Bacteroides] pectinophilus ATCC 43243]